MRYTSSIFIYLFLLTACSHEKNYTDEQSNTIAKNTLLERIIPIDVNNAGKLNEQDLAAFAKKIENVRILALGEQTHGAGSVFALKTQLIKYLHQNHGFDLFILESGMYDVDGIMKKANVGESITALAPGNIFYMYANSAQVTPLFDYINEQLNSDNPLTMVGFDSQHTGALSLNNLVADLSKAQSLIDEKWVESDAWQIFSQQIQQVLNGSQQRLSSSDEQFFFAQLDKLNTSFKQSNNGFWSRISQGLSAQAKRQWQIVDNRSEQMGENIKWWAEQYPDKKIIVWAHTWHLTKQGNEQVNAGKVVHSAFGDEYYVVHFTGEQGKYVSYLDLSEKNVNQPREDSIEYALSNSSNSVISYLENKSLPLVGNDITAFSNNYQATLPAKQWSTYWDGMFILKDITPSTNVK